MYIKSSDESILLNADRTDLFSVTYNANIKRWDVKAYTSGVNMVLGSYKTKAQADITLGRLALAVTDTTRRIFRIPPDTEEEN